MTLSKGGMEAAGWLANRFKFDSATMLRFRSFFLRVLSFTLSSAGLEELTLKNSAGMCVWHLHL